ncbi:MAG: excinuclease ABC subunit UvrA [Gemmataceae bacterium]|nr:excinuclease ABC subunit UvrA [Gemmataceae bacterium]
MADSGGWIRVRGAREHNLHNVDLDLPRERLTVLTGPSGSGKSSLAFDTLYAEGQRRYLETLRGDTRALFDPLQRPDVDLVEGLPPTLCVAQHPGAARLRSTLATLTEIHDHLRLLWTRLGTPHCSECGTPIRRHTPAEILRQTLGLGEGRKIYMLAPLVRSAKGEHRDVFQQIRQAGFLRARIDGVLTEVRDIPRLNPKVEHTIDLVVDRLVVREGIRGRLAESIAAAVKHGGGTVVITDADDGDWHDRVFSTRYACSRCGLTYPELEPRSFSFNNPHGACPACEGLGRVWEIDPERVLPDRNLTAALAVVRLREQTGGVVALPVLDKRTLLDLAKAFPHPQGKSWGKNKPLRDWPPGAVQALLHGTVETERPVAGIVPGLERALREAESGAEDAPPVEALAPFAGYLTCRECGGARLNRAARSVRFAGRGIHEVTALTVDEATDFFTGLPDLTPPTSLPSRGRRKKEPLAPPPFAEEGAGERGDGLPAGGEHIRAVVVGEILHRLRFLQEVGLGYLTLDRPAPTLSGGEAQRARLATHLGTGLLGICYVLDEPTVGLHPRDTSRLLAALRGLERRGNTVLVVEHDETVMRAADYLVDMGPGAGKDGGRVLARGTVAEVLADPHSVTAEYLRAGTAGRVARPDLPLPTAWLTVRGARHHNLKGIDAAFPLGRLVCVTGVSGSGKSSLVRDTLAAAARRALGLPAPPPGAHDAIEGLEQIDKLIEVDQSALGRSPRSSPATYTGVFDEVRRLFAATRAAKVRGYGASRFSFNVKGGRCEECQGQGVRKVALHLLPDLTVPCPVCRGRRFNRATLEVRCKGRSIADVLDLSVEAALAFFANVPSLARPLQALADVGLGYLTLGQPSNTLSGGEAQRVKLATELGRSATGRTLFLLDEPTTGLHFADVVTLLRVLRRLIEPGNSVVVIEHNLDVIAAADWILDLGPEGGAAGGQLLVAGPPEAVAACPASVTGRFLRDALTPTS